MNAAGSLLVRLPNPIGDVVAAVPLLAGLRAALPQARITCAGGAAAAELLAGLDDCDDFLVLPGGDLRRADADTALILPNSWSSALAARAAGIPRRIGRHARGRGWLLTERLPPIRAPRPMTALYWELGAPLGLDGAPPPARLAVTAAERDAAARRLGPEPGVPLLAVAPGAAFGASKLVPLPILAAAVRTLRQRCGLRPLLLGSAAEAGLLRALGREIGPPLLQTADAPAGLGETKALLRRCAALLSMDSGARAMAAALDVPWVAAYGPTDPRWSDFGREIGRVVRLPGLPCSPCHLKTCPIDRRCLARIAPEALSEAVGSLLADPGPRPAGARPAGGGGGVGGPCWIRTSDFHLVKMAL